MKSDPVNSSTLANELAKVLNLPKNLVRLELTMSAMNLVQVSAEWYPSFDAAEFASVLSRYQLTQIDAPPPPAPPINFDEWLSARTEHAHAQFMARPRPACDLQRG